MNRLTHGWFVSRRSPRLYVQITDNYLRYSSHVVLPHPKQLPEGTYGELSARLFLLNELRDNDLASRRLAGLQS